MAALFDLQLRRLRRDRAARQGFETFLLDRAFEDCLERLTLVRRPFENALLVGSPNRKWPDSLRMICPSVEVFDPGPLAARQADGNAADEHQLPILPETYDLVVAVGTLDTAAQLDEVLLRFRLALKPDGFLLGAMSGGDTLPQLRAAMRAADAAEGRASPHVHPRLAPSALTHILTSAGFAMPVVDVDRVGVSYPSFDSLIRDLRCMAATNILFDRPKIPVTRRSLQAATDAFNANADNGNVTETFEVLHFGAWAPAADPRGAAIHN